MGAPKLNRLIPVGEKIRVQKKTWLVDKERQHEGIPKGVEAQPIEENVTGIEGRVASSAYQSPTKGGAWHVPVEVGSGGIISVPVERIERENKTPTLERNPEGSLAVMSKETIDFWRGYFKDQDELKELRKLAKKKRK